MGTCLSLSILESLVALDHPDADALAHVRVCPSCAARMAEIEENRSFLGRHGGAMAMLLSEGVGRWGAADPGRVPGYELYGEIARGGQGVVFLAMQVATRRPAALKLLLGGEHATPKQQARFEREVELAASLRHANIVGVFDSGWTDRGARYVAMEHVQGVPIDVYVQRKIEGTWGSRPWIDSVTRLFVEVAAGVGHAHTHGVIHRDLKPSNILVDQSGTPRILDFGLARPAQAVIGVGVTREFVGTPAFAAPEQLAGDVPGFGARTDVYALCVTLYRSLAGAHPYPCDGPLLEISRHVRETDPTRLSVHLPRIPTDLETIILRGLAKDPTRRYADANALRADLESYLEGAPIEARRDNTLYVLLRLALRHKSVVAAGVGIVVTVLLAVLGLAFLAVDLDRWRREAEDALAESTVQRARLMGSLGDVDRAEGLLWQEALSADMATGAEVGFTGPSEAVRSAWSLIELYSKLPRLFRVSVGESPRAVGVDALSGCVWVTDLSGERHEISLQGFEIGRDLRVPVVQDALTLTAIPGAHGRAFVASTRDGLVLRDRRDGSAVGPVEQRSPLVELALSEDGSLLATAFRREPGGVAIRDGVTLELMTEFFEDAYSVCFAAFEGEPVLLIGSWSGANARVTIRRTADWTVVRRIDLPESARAWRGPVGVRLPRLSPDGHTLAVGLNSDVYVYDLSRPGDPLVGTRAGLSPIMAIDFGGSNTTLSLCRHDGWVEILRVSDLEVVAEYLGASAPTAFGYDAGSRLAVVGEPGRVSVYDTTDRPWLGRIPTGSASTAAVAAGTDGTLVWGGEEGILFVRSSGTATPLSIAAHSDYINSVDIAPNGAIIASGAADGTVRLWRPDGEPAGTLGSGLGRVWCVRFSPDGLRLAASTDGGVVHIWTLCSALPPLILRTPSDRSPSIAFSPDGATLVSGGVGEGSAASIWDVSAGTLRARLDGHGRSVRAVAASPRGDVVATGGDDRVVRFWEARTGRMLGSVGGLPWGPFSMVFHPSGSVLFVVGAGGSVVVIDPLAPAEVATIGVHERLILGLAISNDGGTVYTVGQDPQMGLIDLTRLQGYVRGNQPYLRRELSPCGGG